MVGAAARFQWKEESFVNKETKKGNIDDSFPSLAVKFGREKCQKNEGQGKFILAHFVGGHDQRKCSACRQAYMERSTTSNLSYRKPLPKT